jgi:antitoxin (DNA-binding transcriptional repressor) of toxin-antitoxin stability system
LTVVRADHRLHVEGLSAPIVGEAVAAGDVVWVTVRGEVFAFTVTHGGRQRSAAGSRRVHAAMSATVVHRGDTRAPFGTATC